MNTEKITVETTVHAPAEKVWDYYTKPEHITNWNFATDEWHCPAAENDLRPGGRYFSRMEARDGSFGFDFEGIYTEVEEGKHFTYEFGGRTANVKFEPSDDATIVSVTFDPEEDNPVDMQQAGWQAILNNFKKYVEGK